MIALRTLFVAGAVAASSAASVQAAEYPLRPIRLVVPFAPGGATDTIARGIGQRMSDTWGKQVVVDNRSGGNGVIGMETVARASADGHTLVLGYIANLATAPALQKGLPYDPIKDFTPVSHVASGPSIAVIHPGVPAKNLTELIDLARAKPAAVSYGTASVGAIGHLTGELLNRMANVKMQHVPYKGGGQAVIDAIAGQIPMIIIGIPAAMPHVKSGRLRAIAVTGANRTPVLPEVPTIAEQGFPKFAADAWYGVLTTAGTPRLVVAKLEAEVQRISKTADFRDRLVSLGFDVVGSTGAQFATLIREEIVKWTAVIRDAGIVQH